MNNPRWLTGTLLTGLGFCLCMAPLPAAENDPASNAALQYWRAFQFEGAVVSEDGSVTNAYHLIRQAMEGKFSRHTDEYFQRIQPYLGLMQFGASQPYCDWGPHSHPLQIPHLLKGRSLVHLAAGRIRHLISSGQNQTAIELFNDALKLSGHLDDGTLLIGTSQKNSLRGVLINAVGSELPGLERKDLVRLAQILDEEFPPARPRLGETFKKDYRFGLRSVRTAVESLKDEEVAELKTKLQEMGVIMPKDPTQQEFKQLIRRIEERLEQVAEVLNQPNLAAAQEELMHLEAAREEVDVERVLLGSARGAVRFTRNAEVRRQMMRAALAMLLDGKEALSSFPEPYVQEPFQYERQFRDRFVLRSNHVSEDRPRVELQVGQLDSIQDAAAAGDVEQVRFHLQQGIKPDRQDSQGWAPLHHAARHGRLHVVELLVSEGANIHLGVGQAIGFQIDPELAKRYGLTLPKPGEGTRQKAAAGAKTALDLAIAKGHEDVISFLKENGARPGAASRFEE